jgi:nucleoside-diphosphate-sugar epimerase
METSSNIQKIAIYGGNGFVGCKVAEVLAAQGPKVISVSRSGHRPLHLKNTKWAEDVDWIKGDASHPDLKLLKKCTTLICLVGSPPLPAIGKKAFDKQVFTNGITNSNAIKAAGDAGIRHIVLLSAKIPSFLDKNWFGYAQGKKISLKAAQEFSQISDSHHAVVLKPGAIYGKRHTASGTEIPIDIVMRPLSKVLPSQLISLEKVATRIAEEALAKTKHQEMLKIIDHRSI